MCRSVDVNIVLITVELLTIDDLLVLVGAGPNNCVDIICHVICCRRNGERILSCCSVSCSHSVRSGAVMLTSLHRDTAIPVVQTSGVQTFGPGPTVVLPSVHRRSRSN